MIRKISFFLLGLMPSIALAQVSDNGKPIVVITNASIGAATTFDSDTIYNLAGFVYVEDGEVLTIQPGTIIKSNPGSGAAATALIVARGGKILANGTAAAPIIFTSIADDLDDKTDIPLPPSRAGRGLWGGIIILGKARMNDPLDSNSIEGLPVGDPRHYYGSGTAATDDNDNSGVLTYVSIRHGGSVIGANNEINGLTLGAVGRGTTINNIEVFQTLDDGFEMFGGSVVMNCLISAFQGDDAFDWDEGYSGGGQFWLALQDSAGSERAGELDGGGQRSGVATTVEPYGIPLVSNWTAIGYPTSDSGSQGLEFRDNTGGGIFNSIVWGHKNVGVRVENRTSTPDTISDSRERLSVGDLKLQNNLFFGNVAGSFSAAQTWVSDSVFGIPALNNLTADPVLASIVRRPVDSLDPRPDPAGPAANSWVDPVTNFNPPGYTGPSWAGLFQTVDYVGAFDPDESVDDSWAADWTYLHWGDYLNDIRGCCVNTVGNIDNDPGDLADISDLTVLIDHLFINFPALACPAEGNIDADAGGAVDISDLTVLIDHLFINFPPLPNCL